MVRKSVSGMTMMVSVSGEGLARRNFDRMVTWEEAANRIRDMYEDGNYVDNLISNNAIEQEQEEMTNLLALHFRILAETGKKQSYSDWQDVVSGAWTDQEEADAIVYRFEWLQKYMDENPGDYHRWEIQHNPEYFNAFRIFRGAFLGRPEIYGRTSGTILYHSG